MTCEHGDKAELLESADTWTGPGIPSWRRSWKAMQKVRDKGEGFKLVFLLEAEAGKNPQKRRCSLDCYARPKPPFRGEDKLEKRPAWLRLLFEMRLVAVPGTVRTYFFLQRLEFNVTLSWQMKAKETCTSLFLEGVSRKASTGGGRSHEERPVEEVVLVHRGGYPVGNRGRWRGH